jgi:hypothetical protein
MHHKMIARVENQKNVTVLHSVEKGHSPVFYNLSEGSKRRNKYDIVTLYNSKLECFCKPKKVSYNFKSLPESVLTRFYVIF